MILQIGKGVEEEVCDRECLLQSSLLNRWWRCILSPPSYVAVEITNDGYGLSHTWSCKEKLKGF